jgi:hypothetical protein
LISWVLAERKAGFAARLVTGVLLAAVSASCGSFYASVGPSYERQLYRSSLFRIEALLASGRNDEVLRAIRAANVGGSGTSPSTLWAELPAAADKQP